ncbi:MAG: glycosyltransferase family 9 protein [Ignavibacteria bacterium]
MAIKKILILRFSSLGDIILTTPLLKILRTNFPEAQIDYCTKKSYSDLLKYNPAVSNVLEVSDDMDFAELRLLKKILIKNKYDLVIDLHNNLRTFYLKLSLRLRTLVVVFKKYSYRKFLLVHFKINRMKDMPSIAQRYIGTIKHIIDVNTIELTPEIFTNEYAVENAKKLLNNIYPSPSGRTGGAKLICIVPSSKHFTKTYPAENYIELINKFDKDNYKFALAGAGKDKDIIGKIKSGTDDNVYNLCDKLSLPVLSEFMKMCDLVISGDTGPMHIAEAAGVPIIMLAGSSVKEFGFYPSPLLRGGVGGEVLEVNNLPCRPCSHIGKDYCPKGHFKCMKDITPNMVYEKIMSQVIG